MKKKIKVFYLYPTSRSEILKEGTFAYGRTNLFYGSDCLHKYNIEAKYSNYGFERSFIPWLSRKLSAFIQNFFNFPIDFSQIITSYTKILKSDIIFATSQRQGLPLVLLKYFKIVRKPVVFGSIGFPELLKTTFKPNIGFLKRVFKCADKIICYGWQEKEDIKSLLDVNDKKIEFIPLGVDTHFFRPDSSKVMDFILSAGIDKNRDYQTLLSAVNNLNMNILLVTSAENIEGLKIPANIKVYYKVPYVKLKEFCAQSRFIVIPVKENSYTAGTITLLEAMAMTKAVIVSNTGAIKKGYNFSHNENCFLVTPGDVDELKSAINYLYNHPEECIRIGRNARKTVEEHYSRDKYAKALATTFRDVCMKEE